LRLLTAWLHLLQPLARLRGRLDHGLTPWRRRRPSSLSWPGGGTWTLWTERRREPNDWLVELQQTLRLSGYVVRRGGDFDGWDFEVRTGTLGGVRVLMSHEEHGRGRQLVRLRAWPHAGFGVALASGLVALSVLASAAGAAAAAVSLVALAGVVAVRGLADCAGATGTVRDVFQARARAALQPEREADEPLDDIEKVA
jgi:hypothetical protein